MSDADSDDEYWGAFYSSLPSKWHLSKDKVNDDPDGFWDEPVLATQRTPPPPPRREAHPTTRLKDNEFWGMCCSLITIF